MLRIRKLIIIAICAIGLTVGKTTQAQEINEALESQATLPSMQTQSQLDQLSPNKIGTRQAPDEEGTAQKETPIAGVSLSVIALMTLITGCYAFSKKTNFQKMQK